MTITEAEQNWKLSRNTIFGYIADGLIDKLSVENNQISATNHYADCSATCGRNMR